ncbi:MAG: peroxiredoxin family protein [Alistipes finegoldii]
MRRSELLHHGQRRTRTRRLGIPDRQRPYGTGRRHRMRRQHDPAAGPCRRTGDRPAGQSGAHPRRHRRHLPRTGRHPHGSDGRQTGLRGIRHAAERQKTGVRRANGRLRPQIPRTSPRRTGRLALCGLQQAGSGEHRSQSGQPFRGIPLLRLRIRRQRHRRSQNPSEAISGRRAGSLHPAANRRKSRSDRKHRDRQTLHGPHAARCRRRTGGAFGDRRQRPLGTARLLGDVVRPCCREIPHLREAYAACKSKGLEIYGVSLDNDAAKWRTFVADNDMPWINVLGVNADKRSDAAAMYGISSIPANFLISPEGIIVARDLRGENIKARLEEAMR